MQVLIAMQVLESSGKANCKRGKARNLNVLSVSDLFQTCFRPVSDLFQTCFRPVSDLFYAIIIPGMVLVVVVVVVEEVPML